MLETVTEVGQDSETFSIKRDANGFERVVFAELILPESLNRFGDFHTKRSIREFAYAFMIHGFGIDIEHDGTDRTGRVNIVESFIARPGDPDFVEGAWVIGAYIPDDELWQKVLDHDLNGFSYEALVQMLEVEMLVPVIRAVVGVTESDPFDGHTHEFFVLLDQHGDIVAGGTKDTNFHSHLITRHTFTAEEANHVHIFNYMNL